VVTKEVAPALPRFGIGGSPWHHSGDGTPRNVEAEHEKFGVNAGRTPGRVLGDETSTSSTPESPLGATERPCWAG